MLGFEIREDAFSGIAGEQETADVYVGPKLVAEFGWPCAKLQAVIYCLLNFWRKGSLPDIYDRSRR